MDERWKLDERWKRFALAAFLLLAFLFVVLALLAQWSALEEALQAAGGVWSVRVGGLVAAGALATANLLGMGMLWTWLARGMGEDVPYTEGVSAWIGSNLGRYIPGKVWQLAGLAAYMRSRDRSGAVAVVSALVFQIVVLVSGIAAALLTLRDRMGGAVGFSPLLAVIAALALAFLLLHIVVEFTRGHGDPRHDITLPQLVDDQLLAHLAAVG